MKLKIKQLSSYDKSRVAGHTWFTETEITDPEGMPVSQKVRSSGEWQFEEIIGEPKLWWPNGLGSASLIQGENPPA